MLCSRLHVRTKSLETCRLRYLTATGLNFPSPRILPKQRLELMSDRSRQCQLRQYPWLHRERAAPPSQGWKLRKTPREWRLPTHNIAEASSRCWRYYHERRNRIARRPLALMRSGWMCGSYELVLLSGGALARVGMLALVYVGRAMKG